MGQVSNKVSDDRSRVLQRPCQPVRWSYPSNLASPCVPALLPKIEEFGRSVLSQKYSGANNRRAGIVIHCRFLPHSLLRTLLNFSTVGSAETLNPWHLIKRLVQNLRWHSRCTAGSAGSSSVTLPSPQSTKPRPMRL